MASPVSTGAQAADGADIIVFMDGDGADDPAAIAALIAPIRAGTCDFVIASRARGEREPGSMAWHQLLAGRVAGRLTQLLYGVRYTDMCAFRAIRRDTLLALGMRELTYGWNLEMQMRVARAGLRVRELPVAYRCRLGGQSKVAGSLRGSIKAGLKIMSTFARIAIEPVRGARVSYIATLRRKPSTLPRKLSAAFSTDVRRRQHRVGRTAHLGDGAGDALQHGYHRFRAGRRGRDIVGYLPGRGMLLLDRTRRSPR